MSATSHPDPDPDRLPKPGATGATDPSHGPAADDRLLRLVTPDRAAELTTASLGWPSLTLTPVQLAELELLLVGAFGPNPGYPAAQELAGVPVPILAVPAADAEPLAAGDTVALRDPEGVMIAALHVRTLLPAPAGSTVRLVGTLDGVRLPHHPDHPALRLTPDQLRAELRARGWTGPQVGAGAAWAVWADGLLHTADVGRIRALTRQGKRCVVLAPVGGADPADAGHHLRVRCLQAALDAVDAPLRPSEATLASEAVASDAIAAGAAGRRHEPGPDPYRRPGTGDHPPRHRSLLVLVPAVPSALLATPREPGMSATVLPPAGGTRHPLAPGPAGFEPAGFEPSGLEPSGFEPSGLEPAALSSAGPAPAGVAPAAIPLEPDGGAAGATPSANADAEVLARLTAQRAHLASSYGLSGSLIGPAIGAPGRQELASLLDAGGPIPAELTPPAVAAELARAIPPRSQRGLTIFFTGLSGSGKSTLAGLLVCRLLEQGGRRITLLDGDVVRAHLSQGLGFSRADRDLNVRRIGFVAAQVAGAGGTAVCAPIAPYARVRTQVREMVQAAGGGFVLVHVSTPLEVCEARDRKGLYAKARAGVIPAFTGVSDPYEQPTDADVTVDTAQLSGDEAVDRILDHLRVAGWLTPA
ncbi:MULTISPECIES: adenylyl-sulfate kinase [Frankia]|uniref:adenylyl-sulfate kinase n=1 Tax=Frankia alni (strain DSM 45986 / CECT 9034 / ACN14a) TaxID=326424 RepID=Q0RNY1_FRAAA|nr:MULTISPECIES: adenylyl-sulfate kinase [Frankia]CAJ60755.1 adenosine 5'-phosphosulfate kinase (partial match) [Frankia alni ACN14a]